MSEKKKFTPATMPEPVPVTEPENMIYCGPTIKGTAKQYTAFVGGIPAALQSCVDSCPLLSELIVPVSQLAEVRADLAKDSARRMIFEKCVKIMKGGK